MAHLEADNGPSAGTRYDLVSDQVRLGRHPSCEVVIDSGGAVSRFHAEIRSQEGEFFLSDSKSHNGTLLNGRMIDGVEKLFDQDVIQICDLAFKFSDQETKPRQKLSANPVSVVEDSALDVDESSMSRLEISGAVSRSHVHATSDAKLGAITEMLESLGKTLTVDAVLPSVLESIFKVFPQTVDGVIVLREADGNWEPRFWQSRGKPETRVCVSRSVMDHVMTKRVGILSRDAVDDSQLAKGENTVGRTFMCVPLLDADGSVIGALQVTTVEDKSPFSEADLELLAAVAWQAGIAIGRAQLHDQFVEVYRKESELDLAQDVELQLIPDSNPVVAGYDFFCYYHTANKIGGNYYDYVKLPDGRLVMFVADVFGAGGSETQQIAKLQTDARFCLKTIDDPAEVVARLNQLLCDNNIDGQFVTMVMMILNPLDSEMVIVNAGHSSPILKNSKGEVVILPSDSAGPLLGVVDGAEYTAVTQRLALNESLTIFTDGVFEAMKSDENHYGEDRLVRQLLSSSGTAAEMGETFVQDVELFLRETNQKNDICLLTVRRKP